MERFMVKGGFRVYGCKGEEECWGGVRAERWVHTGFVKDGQLNGSVVCMRMGSSGGR